MDPRCAPAVRPDKHAREHRTLVRLLGHHDPRVSNCFYPHPPWQGSHECDDHRGSVCQGEPDVCAPARQRPCHHGWMDKLAEDMLSEQIELWNGRTWLYDRLIATGKNL